MAEPSSPHLRRAPSNPSPLHVIDPSPDDESPPANPPTASSSKSYFPSSAASTSSPGSAKPSAFLPSTHTLSLIQRYSSYTFTAFAALHLTNTALLPLAFRSAPAATPSLLLTRPYYQSWPVAEPLLVAAPLALHIAAGLALRARRAAVLRAHYGAGAPAPLVSPVSASGFASAALVAGHVGLSRALPLWADGGSSAVGLEYIGHGVARAPALATLGFAALVVVAAGHMVFGWARWLGVVPPTVPGESAERVLRRKRRGWGVWGVAAAVVGVWLAGGVGVVGQNGRVEGWVGATYDRIYESAPVVGRWL